jgi:alpha-ketoglutarate-dependent taurine dioxygenase
MSAQAYIEDQLDEQPAIDETKLQSRGWVSFQLRTQTEKDLQVKLLSLADRLGKPASTRSGRGLCDVLLPTESNDAKPHSLSKVYAFGEFPMHTDTAHWLKPCRFVILACVSPGRARRPTLLLDTRRLPFNEYQSSLLRSTPLRITNGRNSFFSTILSKGRPFVRFDPGCMTATTCDGSNALAVLAHRNWPEYIEIIQWEEGTVLVLDNWRVLHGRGHADCPDFDRSLLRVSVR